MSWMALDEDLPFKLSQTPIEALKRANNLQLLAELQKVVGSIPPWVTFHNLLVSNYTTLKKCP